MPSKSKTKGNAFERSVADHLTTVFEYNFERVPNSGAFVGGKNNQRYDSLSKSQQLIYEGDILVPDELYHLKIECKSYKAFAWHQLFSRCKQLDEWIEQAHSPDKLWFLIFKINRAGSYVCFDDHHLESFSLSKNMLLYHGHIICSYDNFFEANKDMIMSMSDE